MTAAAFLPFVIYFLPILLVRHSGTLTTDDLLQATNNARTSVAQIISGIGLLGTLFFTARTFLLSRAGQVTSQYESGVQQLGGNNVTIRIGGIYALEQAAKESNATQQAVSDVLNSFVRERTKRRVRTMAYQIPVIAGDVQAALTVLGRRDRHGRNRPLDLCGSTLSGADLRRMRLDGAHLRDANLDQVRLSDASLNGAELIGARLCGADLSNATFRDADLTNADLSTATLYRTDFAGAILKGCRLHDRDLSEARNVSEAQRLDAIL